MSGPRVLILDIETLPIEAYVWSLFDQTISIDMIKHDWSILSVAWMWLDDKKAQFAAVSPKTPRDDKGVCLIIRGLLAECDILVTQNGKSFDMRKIKARMLIHGIPPFQEPKHIDTKVEAQRHFAHASHKLAWQAKLLGVDEKDSHKKFPGFELWEACMDGNLAAFKELEKYNKKDVLATKGIYLKMRPWLTGHPNLAVYGEGDEEGLSPKCPKCGSYRMQRRGYFYTQTGRLQSFQCQGCGGWSRGRHQEKRATSHALLNN